MPIDVQSCPKLSLEKKNIGAPLTYFARKFRDRMVLMDKSIERQWQMHQKINLSEIVAS